MKTHNARSNHSTSFFTASVLACACASPLLAQNANPPDDDALATQPPNAPKTSSAADWSDTRKGWRLQASADYFRYQAGYELNNDVYGIDVDGTKEGDLLGGTFSLGLPKWNASSWLDLSYHSGALDGEVTYDYPGFGSLTTGVDTDLTELELRFRSSLKRSSFGISFLYQDWETTEQTPGFAAYQHDLNAYLMNFYLGYGWGWRVAGGFGLGLRGDLGFGLGYADYSRAAAEDGVLFDVLGTGTAFLQYDFQGNSVAGKVFVEGGMKGAYYFSIGSDESEGNISSESQYLYGPFARAGVMFRF